MKVIAHRGDAMYVLEVSKKEHWSFDAEQGKVFKGLPLGSIMARGYWEAWEGDEQQTADVLKAARAADAAEIDLHPSREAGA